MYGIGLGYSYYRYRYRLNCLTRWLVFREHQMLKDWVIAVLVNVKYRSLIWAHLTQQWVCRGSWAHHYSPDSNLDHPWVTIVAWGLQLCHVMRSLYLSFLQLASEKYPLKYTVASMRKICTLAAWEFQSAKCWTLFTAWLLTTRLENGLVKGHDG